VQETATIEQLLVQVKNGLRTRLEEYAYALETELPEGSFLIPAPQYLDSANLSKVLAKKAHEMETGESKVVGSSWLFEYAETVVPLSLIMATAAGLGFDSSLENTLLVVRDEQVSGVRFDNLAVTLNFAARNGQYVPPELAGVLAQTDSLDVLHHAAFGSLFGRHFAPLIERLHELSGASRKLLWGMVGRACFNVYKYLNEELGGSAVQEDYRAVLEEEMNPAIAPEKNPLYRVTYYLNLNDPAVTGPAWVQRSCCLRYRVGQQRLCTTCPLLKPEERLERWRNLYAPQASA
jgi:ferric iron reductase protein FhuF